MATCANLKRLGVGDQHHDLSIEVYLTMGCSQEFKESDLERILFLISYNWPKSPNIVLPLCWIVQQASQNLVNVMDNNYYSKKQGTIHFGEPHGIEEPEVFELSLKVDHPDNYIKVELTICLTPAVFEGVVIPGTVVTPLSSIVTAGLEHAGKQSPYCN
nr:hypothetical protein [Himastelon rhabdovirus 1]